MKITLFKTSFDKVIIRYYIMMAVIIGSFYAGVPFLALLALPIFLSAILGVDVKFKRKRSRVFYPDMEKSEFGHLAAA